MTKYIPEILFFICVIVFISSCETEREKEVELKVSLENVSFEIKMMDSTNSVDDLYKEMIKTASVDSIDYESTTKRYGFAYTDSSNKTTIVIASPDSISYKEFEKTLGHEVVHVLFGKFHEENGRLPTKLIIK